MPELIAHGTQPDDRWRRRLPPNTTIELGRQTAPWSIPWDSSISRRHLILRLEGDELAVTKILDAKNPVFYQGEEQASFRVRAGEKFVVGQTTFTLVNEIAFATQDVPNPISQRTFSSEFIRAVPYQNADRRIAVLNRLPTIISSATNEQDLMIRFINLLLTGISQATSVGLVRLLNDQTDVLRWDHRDISHQNFEPSDRLIHQAIESNETVLHIWGEVDVPTNRDYTFDYENDWAFVTPLQTEACQGWGVYVAGKNRINPGSATDGSTDAEDMQGDIKFAELVGSTMANVLQVKKLERRQASLRPFFAPIVLDAIANQDPETVLTPRECDVSVLFCDLRGFSKTSEEMAHDLLGLLDRVSQALGITTRHILEGGGVVGDFHGDSAMGFWGWPLEQPNASDLALGAAQRIQSEIARIAADSEHPLRNFAMGMGIATGPAVAGQIGTQDQVKVTVFGPVVNFAARLESLTRQFQCGVLLDAKTASTMNQDSFNTRRLATVQPFGLESTSEIFQLLPDESPYTDAHLATYKIGLRHFESGQWDIAAPLLKTLEHDGAARFLQAYISEHRRPSPEWDGTIVFTSK